jgi:hypothetical protein
MKLAASNNTKTRTAIVKKNRKFNPESRGMTTIFAAKLSSSQVATDGAQICKDKRDNSGFF